MQRVIGLTLIFAASSFIGCSFHVPEREEIYGTYQAEYPFGRDILTLKPDSTFDQTVVVYERPDTVSYSGTWDYEPDGDVWLNGGLTLVGSFCSLRPGYATPVDARIHRGVVVPRIAGTPIKLYGGCEGEHYFVKQE